MKIEREKESQIMREKGRSDGWRVEVWRNGGSEGGREG